MSNINLKDYNGNVNELLLALRNEKLGIKNEKTTINTEFDKASEEPPEEVQPEQEHTPDETQNNQVAQVNQDNQVNEVAQVSKAEIDALNDELKFSIYPEDYPNIPLSAWGNLDDLINELGDQGLSRHEILPKLLEWNNKQEEKYFTPTLILGFLNRTHILEDEIYKPSGNRIVKRSEAQRFLNKFSGESWVDKAYSLMQTKLPETVKNEFLDYGREFDKKKIPITSTGGGDEDYKNISKAFRDVDDFLKIEFPKRKVIIDPWLKEQSITLISGWRGSGKTWFGLTLALLAVGGLDYPLSKWDATNPVPTLYIEAEMAGEALQERVHKLETDSLNKERLIIYSDHDANLQGLPPARLGNDKWRKAIKDLIISKKIKLVFFDNISALCPENDENTKQPWGPINSWLLELRFIGVASILVHHTGKKGDQRGHSGREDNIDNSILLAKPSDYTDKDGCKFNLHFTKCRGINDADRHLIVDTEFWLKDVDEYHSSWSCGTLSKKKFTECVHMLSSGMKQTEIASNLGISKMMVTKYFQKAQVNGYLTRDKKLTDSGRNLVKTLPEYNDTWQENELDLDE